MSKLISILFLIVLVPSTHLLHLFLNETYKDQKINIEERFNLPSPDITKVASIGFDNFLADILWIQLIQYYGTASAANSEILPELYSVANNIVTLDPNFIDAYIFSAYALADNKEFDNAINILEKGIKENPKEWYLAYQIGFMYYINKKNKLVASRYLNRASNIEGAPSHMKQLAAKMASDSSTDLSIQKELWTGVYQKAKEEGDKVNQEKAEKKLIELKIEQDLKVIREAIEKYNNRSKVLNDSIKSTLASNDKNNYDKKEIENKKSTLSQTKFDPGDINQSVKPLPQLDDLKLLVDYGFLNKFPLDPFNRPYLFNPNTQEVKSFPLPWKS